MKSRYLSDKELNEFIGDPIFKSQNVVLQTTKGCNAKKIEEKNEK